VGPAASRNDRGSRQGDRRRVERQAPPNPAQFFPELVAAQQAARWRGGGTVCEWFGRWATLAKRRAWRLGKG